MGWGDEFTHDVNDAKVRLLSAGIHKYLTRYPGNSYPEGIPEFLGLGASDGVKELYDSNASDRPRLQRHRHSSTGWDQALR
eukprot:2808040-Rhodomonas_salina.4